MLKQKVFFDKISKKELTVSQYSIMVKMYLNPKLKLNEKHINSGLKKFISKEKYLNENGKRFIKSMEQLFKPMKKVKDIASLEPDFQENVNKYIDMFPSGKLPSNQYAKGNKKGIAQNFMWFLQEYQYSWETIFKATEIYIEEYRKLDYKKMRTAYYFVKKEISGSIISDLANYCEAIKDGNVENFNSKDSDIVSSMINVV